MNVLSFLPKMYFPKSIYMGNKAVIFFQTIKDKKKALIVSRNFYGKNKEFIDSLGAISKLILHQGEPRVTEVEKIQQKLSASDQEYLIAIGGGSIIDLTKIIKLKLNVKMVAVPTTIGSGSEVSQFALLTKNNSKEVTSSEEMLPDAIILSPKLLETLTDNQIFFQSLDALTHSLEALVSRLSNPLSDMLSIISFEAIYNNLINFKEKKQISIENIQIASILAGLAQSSAGTGLVHSFAHYLGPKYNLSHSQTVTTFLIPVLKLNIGNTDKYKKIESIPGFSSSNLIEKIEDLYNKLSITAKFHFKDNAEKTSEEIKKDICTLTNPFPPANNQIQEILERFYDKR